MSAITDRIITIRKADKTDISVIGILAHATWPATYGPILTAGQIHYMMDLFYSPRALEEQFDRQHVFLLVLMNAEPVAFASYAHGSKAGMYKVHKLYVHPLLQGKGIGKKLLDRIVGDVRALGASSLELNVNRYNSAREFYARYGFHIAGEEDIAIGEGYFMNDYIMQMEV